MDNEEEGVEKEADEVVVNEPGIEAGSWIQDHLNVGPICLTVA